MNVMAPMIITDKHTDEELMTRRQVAYLFRVTSAAVAIWARRGRLPEARTETGKPPSALSFTAYRSYGAEPGRAVRRGDGDQVTNHRIILS